MSKLDDFGGEKEIANEYADNKTCKKSDVGYHCSCLNYGEECCLCGEIGEPDYEDDEEDEFEPPY